MSSSSTGMASPSLSPVTGSDVRQVAPSSAHAVAAVSSSSQVLGPDGSSSITNSFLVSSLLEPLPMLSLSISSGPSESYAPVSSQDLSATSSSTADVSHANVGSSTAVATPSLHQFISQSVAPIVPSTSITTRTGTSSTNVVIAQSTSSVSSSTHASESSLREGGAGPKQQQQRRNDSSTAVSPPGDFHSSNTLVAGMSIPPPQTQNTVNQSSHSASHQSGEPSVHRLPSGGGEATSTPDRVAARQADERQTSSASKTSTSSHASSYTSGGQYGVYNPVEHHDGSDGARGRASSDASDSHDANNNQATAQLRPEHQHEPIATASSPLPVQIIQQSALPHATPTSVHVPQQTRLPHEQSPHASQSPPIHMAPQSSAPHDQSLQVSTASLVSPTHTPTQQRHDAHSIIPAVTRHAITDPHTNMHSLLYPHYAAPESPPSPSPLHPAVYGSPATAMATAMATATAMTTATAATYSPTGSTRTPIVYHPGYQAAHVAAAGGFSSPTLRHPSVVGSVAMQQPGGYALGSAPTMRQQHGIVTPGVDERYFSFAGAGGTNLFASTGSNSIYTGQVPGAGEDSTMTVPVFDSPQPDHIPEMYASLDLAQIPVYSSVDLSLYHPHAHAHTTDVMWDYGSSRSDSTMHTHGSPSRALQRQNSSSTIASYNNSNNMFAGPVTRTNSASTASHHALYSSWEYTSQQQQQQQPQQHRSDSPMRIDHISTWCSLPSVPTFASPNMYQHQHQYQHPHQHQHQHQHDFSYSASDGERNVTMAYHLSPRVRPSTNSNNSDSESGTASLPVLALGPPLSVPRHHHVDANMAYPQLYGSHASVPTYALSSPTQTSNLTTPSASPRIHPSIHASLSTPMRAYHTPMTPTYAYGHALSQSLALMHQASLGPHMSNNNLGDSLSATARVTSSNTRNPPSSTTPQTHTYTFTPIVHGGPTGISPTSQASVATSSLPAPILSYGPAGSTSSTSPLGRSTMQMSSPGLPIGSPGLQMGSPTLISLSLPPSGSPVTARTSASLPPSGSGSPRMLQTSPTYGHVHHLSTGYASVSGGSSPRMIQSVLSPYANSPGMMAASPGTPVQYGTRAPSPGAPGVVLTSPRTATTARHASGIHDRECVYVCLSFCLPVW